MKWLFLAGGTVLGALAGVSAMIYLQPHDDQIIFAPKHFYSTEAAVVASGTLTGPNLAFPNNYYTIACYQDRKECVISNIEQVGHNQIGDLLAPLIFPVVKWSQGEVIAEDQAGLPSPTGCVKATITIERELQSVLWMQEPINKTQPECQNSDTSVNKWTIEESPGWKGIYESPGWKRIFGNK